VWFEVGFSVAAAAAIIFAGAVVSFTVLATAVQQSADSMREAQDAARARGSDLAGTLVTYTNGTANGTAVELNLTNAGSSVIHVDTMDVLVDGALHTADITLREVDGVSGTALWAPGQVLHLRLQVPAGPTAGVKIVAENGYTFYAQVV
jgi:archaellum component FlaF (FlaF/FlaG flagellin family)